jgi:UPF0176 protein
MQITNIAGYKFLSLSELAALQAGWLSQCESLHLKGTILLSEEGVNVTLAGMDDEITSFKSFLKRDARFADMTFRESVSAYQPFKHLKIKLKKEIITMRRPEVSPELQRAPSISPEEFKQWMDENRDITILDTRNDYEVRFGTFRGAVHFQLENFCGFPEASSQLDPQKPVVMFCTGGVRCEKAGLHLLNEGFSEVYQLDGGILNYFAKVGGVHYDGDCFVFDQRVAVNADLQETGTAQCKHCQGPVTERQQSMVEAGSDEVICLACLSGFVK